MKKQDLKNNMLSVKQLGQLKTEIMLSNSMFWDKITNKRINEFNCFDRGISQDIERSCEFGRKNISEIAVCGSTM